MPSHAIKITMAYALVFSSDKIMAYIFSLLIFSFDLYCNITIARIHGLICFPNSLLTILSKGISDRVIV